jgi:[protein-PII] uridylyltransferase
MTKTGVGENGGDLRAGYGRSVADMRAAFDATRDGRAACTSRSQAVDHLIRGLWASRATEHGAGSLCLVALGGYGRQQLFPCSDVDLLFCTGKSSTASGVKEAIRLLSQSLWDSGLRVSPATRTLAECERFKPSDPEFSLALLDLRFVAGNQDTFATLQAKICGRHSSRESRALALAAAELTRERHARFGNTLFHLEPNVKDSPGGLRDANTCAWLALVRDGTSELGDTARFREALDFLTSTRVFLHLRHGRDDNTLDWHAQDEAAALGVGSAVRAAGSHPAFDSASWMRAYFRHARAIQHELNRELERSGQQPKPPRSVLRVKAPGGAGFFVKDGVLDLPSPKPDVDSAHESEVVLAAFGLIADSGVTLAPAAAERIAAAIPELSASLEDGPRLWSRLRTILTGVYAGKALREMHALGVLELILPEFHGIDALVIRDAYHRYTVDEHTFVLIDVLHGLAADLPADAPEWRTRFRSTLLELPYPELLYLAALLHDTGKGRSGTEHAAASAQLAETVCARLELGAYETSLVVHLIESHLEMSAALRRDIFDTESVRVFADKVQTHDLLRMLTLFTFADISAVHPDALTPWKAENLWRLSMAAANQLDRSVDEERVHAHGARTSRGAETVARALGRSSPEREALEHFLEGFPERYLRTHSPENIRQHMLIASGRAEVPVVFQPGEGANEVTFVTGDRPHLFADLAAALAGWGMDVVTAEAFSNAQGCVVDSFRFVDTYRTLELNPEERGRFLTELRAAVDGQLTADHWRSRRRTRRLAPRRVVETRIEFDNSASSHSTLLQIVAQNVPGLLRTAALALTESGCSVEVALIDTEAEMAIDVFYVTRAGRKLDDEEAEGVVSQLSAAIRANAESAA